MTEYIAIAAGCALAAAVMIWLAARIERSVREELGRGRSESMEAGRHLRDELSGSVRGLGDSLSQTVASLSQVQKGQLELFSHQMGQLSTSINTSVNTVREAVERQLKHLQAENSQKLEEMRLTVDEKLQGTLEKRLNDSFRLVSERLELVHKGLGEMQSLTTGVGDLKRMLTNVKTRGIWGEFQLGNILEQYLSPEQYEANVAIKPRSSDRVEFAIRLPGQEDGKTVLLPIDAKFPLEAYQRLTAALEVGDAEAAKNAADELDLAVRREARRINEKYVDEQHTTPFGIMFLPTEGLYSEVLRRPGLADRIQRDYRVMIAGPTTLTALLSSLQMGFRTVAIQKRSGEIAKHLTTIRSQFSGFSAILENVQKKLATASREVEEATKKSKTIERKLEKFEGLPEGDGGVATGLLPS